MEEGKSSNSDEGGADGEKPVRPEFDDAVKAATQNINQIASISDQLTSQFRKQLQSVEGSMAQIRRGLAKHAESLDKIEQIYEGSFARLAEEIAAQQSEVQSAFSSLSNLPMEKFARQLRTSNEQFAQALSALSVDVARAVEGIDISALQKALLEELEEQRQDIEESVAEQTVNTFIINVYIGAYERLPAGTISKEAILMMILTIILTVYQVQSNADGTQDIVKEIQEVRKVVEDEHLSAPRSALKISVATTDLNLRTEPSMDAPVEMVVGYNQKVEIIKREQDWAYVKFYDDVKEIPRSGWVHTEYLREVD